MRSTRASILIALAIAATSSLTACGVDDSDPVLATPLPKEPPPPPYSATTFTWGDPSPVPQRGRAIVRQPDGKLVVAATANTPFVEGVPGYVDVFRLMPDGTLDKTFGATGSGHSLVRSLGSSEFVSLALSPNGDVYVAGLASEPSPPARLVYAPAIARLDAKGIVDPSWGDAGTLLIEGESAGWCTVEVQSDAKVLTTCGATNALRRFDPTGKLDATFGSAGVAVLPGDLVPTRSFIIDPKGNILLGGYHSTADLGAVVVRLLPTGVGDPTFDVGGIAEVALLRAAAHVALDPAGNIVVAGYLNGTAGTALLRIDPTGAIDPTFNGGTPVVAGGPAAQIAVDATGAIVVWNAAQSSDYDVNFLQRFLSDGTPDPTFDGRAGGQSGWPRAELGFISPDGRIVSVGAAQVGPYGNDVRAAVTRRNADGAPDTTFGFFGTTFTEIAARADIVLQTEHAPNDKAMLLVGSEGNCTLLRVTSDGALDEAFGSHGSIAGIGCAPFMVDDAGRTIAFAQGSVYGDLYLQRFDESGKIDPSFGVEGQAKLAAGYESVNGLSLAPASEGRLLVSGAGRGGPFVFRVNADGTLDGSFGTNGVKGITLGLDPYFNNDDIFVPGRAVSLPDGGTMIFATLRGRTELIRLDASGGYTSFGKLGFARGESAVLATVAAVAQPSGAVIALAIAEQGDLWVLERFDAGGHIDWTFGDGGRILYPTSRGVARPELSVDAGGRVYIATTAKNGRDVVMSRYTVDGAPDESWGPAGERALDGASLGIERVTTMRASADGGLLIAGRRFTQTGGVDVVLAKLSL